MLPGGVRRQVGHEPPGSAETTTCRAGFLCAARLLHHLSDGVNHHVGLI